MSFESWSNEKKKKRQEEQQNTTPSKTSFSEWSDNKLISQVNDEYINNFISETQKFFDTSNKNQKDLGWSNASSYYTYADTTWRDLSTRSNVIKKWLDKNKGNIDFETYYNLSSTLDEINSGASSILDNFKNFSDVSSQFENEGTFNRWFENYKKQEEARQTVLGADDYDYYSQLGASINNPEDIKDVADSGLSIFGHRVFGKEGEDIGNVVTMSRDNADYIGMMEVNGGDTADYGLRSIYRYMTDEEVGIYNYYLAKEGEERASEYLSSLEDTLNQRHGGQMAENVKGNKLLEMTFATAAGLDQFASGVRNLDNYLLGTEGETTSATQYASSEIRQNLDGGWGVAYDLFNTTGNMLPSILVGSFTGGLGGALTLGASATGNAYAEMRKLGYDKWQSRGYATLVGASETALQYALGGISKLGGKVSGNAVGNLVAKLDNAIARTAIKIGGNMLSEGAEEAIQTILEPAFKALVTGEDFESPEWEEVLYSALLGALSAGVLEGAPTIINDSINARRAGKIYGDSAPDLVAESIEIDPENAHAQRMQSRLDNGKNVSGYQLNRLVEANETAMYDQDVAAIKSSAEERLRSLGETSNVEKLAEALTKQASGEKLAHSEKQLIKNSKYGQRVANELNTENISSGEYSSAWAEKIGTNRINAEAYGRSIADPFPASESSVQQAKTPSVTENASAKENAIESKFKVSESGKTKIGDTEVSIKEVASVKNGKMALRLEDGSTVDANDVEYGSNAEGLLYENVVHMGFNAATANAFIEGYDGNMPVADYARDFGQAYRYGELGVPKNELYSEEFPSHLEESKKSYAYDLGKMDAKHKASEKAKIASTSAIKSEKIASKGEKKGKLHNTLKPTNETQRASLKTLGVLAEALNIDIYTFESKVVNGKRQGANGWYDPSDNSIHIDLFAGNDGKGTMLFTAAHELTHHIREKLPNQFKAFADFLFEQYGKKGVSVAELIESKKEVLEANGRITSDITEAQAYDLAYEEVVADSCESFLADGDAVAKIAELKAKNKTLWQTIKDFITNLVERIKAAYKGLSPDSVEGRYVAEMLDSAEKLKAMWTEMLVEASEVSDLVEVDMDTESVAPIMYSERTWTASEYVTHRDQMADKISKALGVSKAKAKSYIDDINSIARMIANDRVRLDYEASSFGSAFVSNVEYGGSFDYTTLCKKRRIYTGTFTEIQKRLKDVALTPDDILTIRNLMLEEGIEATCGLCYVEGSRANMGKFAKEFIRLYKRDNPLAWIPNMADVNTPDGVEQMRIRHPEAYDQYVYFWNHYGKLKDSDPALFASQQKPKLYEARKEYKGEILEHFEDVSTVEKKNRNGGIRMQSFSDFEIVHLIDTMQVIMDMSTVGLAGQAYTKVPEFAKAFGNTGLKINLSLIAKGVDADGNLIFDDREGMPHKTAFELRDKHSKNVGTIIVTFTDEQLLSAMADPRIDFIIPFHRSQWKKGQYGAMGLPKGTKDYTYMQNEKLIKKTYHEYRGRMVLDKASNYMPNEYWDFSKSGKENAEAYLKMCAENNKRPKFYKLLDYDGNGTYSLKADGSTDGYWKLLIDFKMYDNDGVGSPQMAVTPTFNMDEAKTMLDEYQGGHSKYPVASSVVDTFVEKYNKEHRTKYSDRVTDKKTLDFLNKQIEKGEYITTYKSMRLDDGKLHSPMAAEINGKFENDYELGQWYQAVEHPELIKFDKKNGLPYFELDKGVDEFGDDLGKVPARYNPYEHSSNYVINDQFKTAFKRRNLVVVEMRIPLSETTSGYQAQYAKDPVGWQEWKKGDVASALAKKGKERKVFLSRWAMPYRILSDAEVAQQYKELLSGTGVTVPNNVVTPSLLTALENEGVVIDYNGITKFEETYAKKAKAREEKKAKEQTATKTIKYSDRDIHKTFGIKSINDYVGVQKSVIDTLTKEGFFSNERNIVINKDSGMVVEITKDGIKETLGNGTRFDTLPRKLKELKLSMIRDLPYLIETAHLDKDNVPNIHNTKSKLKYAYLSTEIEAQEENGRDTYTVTITIRKSTQKNMFWMHKVMVTKKEQGLSSSGDVNPQQEYNKTLALQDSISQKSESVKRKFSDRNTASFNGKPFWSGSVSLLDGVIEEVHTMEDAEAVDFHHSMYFSQVQVEKMENGENAFFWVDNGIVQGDWRVSVPKAIIERIREQIVIDPKYSDRSPDSVSNRSLLANALESVAQNDIERNKLAQYKAKISLIESEQAKLAEIRAKIKELSFAKGKRDTKAINALQFEANQAANRINTYDRQLLNLESTTALKGVLEREKQMAYKKAQKEGKEALARQRERAANTQRELLTRYQESRKKGIEGRRQTEMRHKIKDVVNELNQYLTKGTKDKHIPIQLQKPVAEALHAVNMDTVGAEARIAKKQAEMRMAKSLDEMQKLSKEIEHIQEMGGKMDAKLSRLKTAYDSIINSDDPLIANSHDDVIANTIDKVIEVVGDTPLRDMSLYQLEAVYDMYRMVLTSIRNANKTFKAEKGKEISVLANTVIADLDGKKRNPLNPANTNFAWNNLKPVYAFERIGSNTFTKLLNAVREGEDVWAKDMSEAQTFREEQSKTHKFDSWDFEKKYTFKTNRGVPFELDLGEMMSIYAFAKDEHSKGHLIGEGFVFDPNKKVVEEVKGKIKVKVNLEDATSYNLSESTLEEIIGTLTPEQKAFADAMQDYLSSTMGEKGNEVSLELYEIKLFKNKHYFPLKVAPQYMAIAKEKAQGDVKIKNKGFTKDRKEGAKNPIVLSSFMDVWASHVNEMSMYHAFTLPLEDFYRVFNYKTPYMEGYAPMSVNQSIQNAHGVAATSYIEQLLKDINGGAISDPRETTGKALMSRFKKASVMASMSVVIQQPSAIVRAMALVDAKYFVGKNATKGNHKETWAEVKKYAPVAVIKEMGYFDTGMGKGSVEWLKGEKTFMDKVDDATSKLPALADEVTWVAIWNAVKRETVHTHKNLRPNSEEFLKVAGERFTEVIVKTQVYDSTLARSANMRSKSALMNMWTAFMAEPTTSINMLQDAFYKGNKKYIGRALGAVVGSVILNSALVSIVYAMRDDDEDETFLEKYLSRFTTEVIDGVNPITYIPFFKDIWSIAQGFDVERADMSLINDVIDSLQQLFKEVSKDTSDMDEDELAEHKKAVTEAILGITDTLASLAGVPVKNVRRDFNGIINGFNTIKDDVNGRETTAGSLGDNILEDVQDSVPVWGWLPNESKSDKLYDAIMKGDTAYIDRLKSAYKSDSAYQSAIRKALRESDSRIHDAAVARYNGDIAEYMRIAKEIIAEGHFKQDDIVSAINSEINTLKKGEESTESSSSNKVMSIYKVDDYYAALVGRDQATAYVVKEDLIKTDVANGKDREEAEADFNSKFASYIREKYEDGDLSDYEAEDMLINYAGKSEEDAYSKVQYWAFKQEYPDYDLSEEAVTKYLTEVEPSGIDISTYYDYTKQRAKCKGTDSNGDGKTDSGSVKSEVLYVIDSLPISSEQKDVLYYLNGWASSTLWEAPWH